MLTQSAHKTVAARCAEIGEDVVSYLQRISLPAAEAHGNEIAADAVEDYVGALIGQRLASEPQLLTRTADRQTGAAAGPAVAQPWRKSFHHAQFLWLTYRAGSG